MKDNATAIESILVRHDPAGLMAIGSPQDEYRHEAKLIAERLVQQYQPCWSATHVAMIPYEVFVEQFSGGPIWGEGPNGEWIEIGYKEPSMDYAEKTIGTLEDFLEIGREIKAMLDE